jgi:hypothetical protein
MKMYLSLLLAICTWQFMALDVSASNQGTTSTYAYGHSTATDVSGNVYVAGYFNSSTITFGTVTLTKTNSLSSSYNMFLVKYGPGGNLLWVTKAGGSGGNDEPHGLVTDNNGNVYLTGGGNDPNITFFSANSGTTITLNNASPYLVKYDQDGNVAWAESVTGRPDWQGIAFAGEYLYRTGSFSGTVKIGTTTLTSVGGSDVFTAEYDLNGNVIWATSAGGSGTEMGIGIAPDGSGNVYITGIFFSPSMKFGTYTLTNRGSSSTADIYFAKYNAYGNLQWATSAGGGGTDNSWSIASDAGGNSYVTGSSTSPSITFYSATPTGPKITLSNSGGENYFSVKYDPNGTLLWAKNAKGSANGDGITLYGNNVYVTGTFNSSTTIFESATLKSKPVPNPSFDIFIVNYDASGNVLWTKGAGGTAYDASQDAATDGSGNIFITGYFHSPSVTFGTITLTLGNTSDYDMFIAKYSPSGTALWAKSAGAPPTGSSHKSVSAGINYSIAHELTVYPNPTTGKVTLSTGDSQSAINSISLFNITGKEILHQQYSAGNSEVTVDLSPQPKGLYIILIKTGKTFYQRKIIVE